MTESLIDKLLDLKFDRDSKVLDNSEHDMAIDDCIATIREHETASEPMVTREYMLARVAAVQCLLDEERRVSEPDKCPDCGAAMMEVCSGLENMCNRKTKPAYHIERDAEGHENLILHGVDETDADEIWVRKREMVSITDIANATLGSWGDYDATYISRGSVIKAIMNFIGRPYAD